MTSSSSSGAASEAADAGAADADAADAEAADADAAPEDADAADADAAPEGADAAPDASCSCRAAGACRKAEYFNWLPMKNSWVNAALRAAAVVSIELLSWSRLVSHLVLYLYLQMWLWL